MTAFEPSLPIATILDALSGERWPVDQAKAHVRPVPGLYAIYGDSKAWVDLGFVPRPGTALYVGKSESSLADRELNTHFAAGRTGKAQTGSSTVRRSFAALLRATLDLHAVPRNMDKPGYFSHYGLTPSGDARLTAWMHKHLTLAVWEQTAQLTHPLIEIETAVIRHWIPPINIDKNPQPLQRLSRERSAMARQAASNVAAEVTTPSAPDEGRSLSEPISTRSQAPRTDGLTPVELAHELGKSPKTVRRVLRDRYGTLPRQGDRWGALPSEYENYVRDRLS
ncbi:hypothetical protein KRR55_17100 [Paeniglutamicibacter sp. ABSL32-1]|uniref:GIY-YIG nuclease family protein n=1 Tax=Paeniglutamicibacter quisquiliarum TaxID=2849498 RepID=UPI001C2D81E6|nr:hypothetical protein [Paeniglutamicibacter quisquiliarum]MBV1780834.1 hypothetical protein [Paeniglutamicibacter quisquiliarum]